MCACLYETSHMLQLVFVSDAARSVEIYIDIVPLSKPSLISGVTYSLYIERKKNAMFIDCTECGKHVFAHVSDKTLACLDLTEAVYCDECMEA